MIKFCMIVFLASALFVNCKSPFSSESKYNPPADHAISKNGAKHKDGLHDPFKNCASCHGQDLKGGTVGVSCYNCHSAKW